MVITEGLLIHAFNGGVGTFLATHQSIHLQNTTVIQSNQVYNVARWEGKPFWYIFFNHWTLKAASHPRGLYRAYPKKAKSLCRCTNNNTHGQGLRNIYHKLFNSNKVSIRWDTRLHNYYTIMSNKNKIKSDLLFIVRYVLHFLHHNDLKYVS